MSARIGMLLLCCWLSACASVSNTLGDWFGNKDNAIPPAELVEFEESLKIDSVWSESVGGGAEKYFLTLTPAYRNGAVYAVNRDGRVLALDGVSGDPIWDRHLKKTVITSGPGTSDDLVVIGGGEGEVIALDKVTGAEQWRATVSSEVLAAPQADDRVVVVRTGDGRLFGLDAASGTRLWSYDRTVPVLSLRGIAQPVIAGDAVIAGFDGGRLAALELANGRTIWETRIAIPGGRTDLERIVDIDSAPIVAGDMVYVASFQGQIAAVSATSGEIEWTREISSYAGLAVDGSHVYVSEAAGQVWALDRLTGASVWKQEALTARQLTQPAVLGEYVVVGDLEGYLHWMRADDGSFVARNRVSNDRIIAPPVTAEDHLIVYSAAGKLAAFGLL